MPVLFLLFITLQYTAALSAHQGAANITLSDATSQNINKFITSRLLSDTHETVNSFIVLFQGH